MFYVSCFKITLVSFFAEVERELERKEDSGPKPLLRKGALGSEKFDRLSSGKPSGEHFAICFTASVSVIVCYAA